MTCRNAALAILLSFFAAAGVRADDWSLTTSDFQTQSAQLKGFSDQGAVVTISDSKSDRIIPLDQFVSIERPAGDDVTPPKFTLTLIGGDRLTGEPAGVAGEKLIWLSPSLGKVPVSFSRLKMMVKGDAVPPASEAPKQDVITLGNGDSASGVFTSIDSSNVTLQTDSGSTTVPLANITRITFAATGPSKKATARALRIHLTDGSIVTVAEAVGSGDQISLTLAGKNAAVVSLPLSSLLGIEQMNGPVTWLSSLAPVENIQTPYLSGEPAWPARFDLAVDGLPLSYNGQTYDRGIGVHAYSRLTFNLDPQWTTFRTQYALESHRDDPARFGDVTVRIKIDGKIVHEQPHVRAGELSPVITQDIRNASTLTLECDFGDSGDTQARLNWLQPALLREAPTTLPTTTP